LRTLFWWLLLLCLCAIAGLVQVRWRRGVEGERRELRTVPTTIEEREQGWARITIGEPSGAAPVRVEVWWPEPSAEEGSGTSPEPPSETPPSPIDLSDPPPGYRPADFVYTVPRGRVLSKICAEFYGTGRPPLPQRVAEYNRMASPDELKEGQVLRLPAWSVLFPGAEETDQGGGR